MAFTLDTKRKQRFDFMRCLYEKTEGSEMGLVYIEEIAEQLRLPLLQTELIALFLADEDLIRIRMRNIISITHVGVDEVETALGHPDKATEHFPPLNAPAEPPPGHHDEIPTVILESSGTAEEPLNPPAEPVQNLKRISETTEREPGMAAAQVSAPEISDAVRHVAQRAQAAPAPIPAPRPPVPVNRAATAPALNPQSAAAAPRASEIADLLASLRLRLLKVHLDRDDLGEAQAEIATAFAQLLSPRPKQSVIAASLTRLLSIFEGAPSVALTNEVKNTLAKISEFLAQL